jgi:hypothetical protein
MYILFSIIAAYSFNIYIFLFVVSSCFILIGYVYSLAKYFTHSFSSQSLYVI